MIQNFNEEDNFWYNQLIGMDRRKLVVNIIGWAGSLMVVLAYFLLTSEYISKEHIAYKLLNLLGAIFLAYRVWCDRNWSNLFLEAIFISIAIKELLL